MDERYRIRAISEGEEGRHLATVEGYWRPVTREELERAEIELPDYLVQALAD